MPIPAFRGSAALPPRSLVLRILVAARRRGRVPGAPTSASSTPRAGRSPSPPVHGTRPDPDRQRRDCFGQGTGGSGDRVNGRRAPPRSACSRRVPQRSGPAPRSRSPTPSTVSASASAGSAASSSQGSSFWYLKRNHVGSQVSRQPDQVHQGDEILWYLIAQLPAASRRARARQAPASGGAERAVPGDGVLLRRRRDPQPGRRGAP